MRPKALLGTLAILSAVALPAGGGELEDSQTRGIFDHAAWRVQLRSTGYAFETANAQGASLDHFGFYQHFDASVSNLADGRLTFRLAGRFADDLNVEPRLTQREKLYAGYAQLATRRSRARLGRQFIQEGPTQLAMDGAWLRMNLRRGVEFRLFGGGRAPANRSYELEDWGDETVAGARMVVRTHPKMHAGISFAYLERGGARSAKPVGFELRAAPMRGLRAMGRASYESLGEEWERLEVTAEWTPKPQWPVFSLHVLDRRPSIGADSWFQRFEIERISIWRSSIRKIQPSGYGAELEIFGSDVATRESGRVSGTVFFPHGSLGYSARIGDAGEESSWIGSVGRWLTPWLHGSAGGTISTYALVDDATSAEERDLVTAFGRLRARVHPGVRLTAELQSVENPIYSEDYRILLGLDLVAASQESTHRLRRGGWVR